MTMRGKKVLSPSNGSSFHSQRLHHPMDEDSSNSEDHEDDVEELFEVDDDDHENGSQHGFGIEGDTEDDGESFFEIGSNIHEDREPVLDPESGDHDNGNYTEQATVVKDNCPNYGTLQVVHEDRTDNTLDVNTRNNFSQEKDNPPPIVGMEFDSYDDAYDYYNCYAQKSGFVIRIKSSWTKRNSNEKRGALLCCNCEGFKTLKEATNRRKETRTGCMARIRLRLLESNRWRVDEVKLEHNHSFDREKVENSKSRKKMEVSMNRKSETNGDVQVKTIKLYRTPASAGSTFSRSFSSRESENGNPVESSYLKLKPGDLQAINDYFCQKQRISPNFFYMMDLNDEGKLRNVFWLESSSRAAYRYFGDVVVVDTTCLSSNYDIPLLSFVGINHHGQSILFGCALIADQTVETYVWLFRAWLPCMLGRPPQTIVTDRSAIQSAISEVFPRAHHRFYLPHVIQTISLNAGPMQGSETFESVLTRTIYGCLKPDEFEACWKDMIQQFGIINHQSLQVWYADREKWAPVYLKDTFLAGLFSVPGNQPLIPFFAGHVYRQTSMKEFFDLYDMMMQNQQQQEALDDINSRKSNPLLTTRCNYELQLSKLYTKEIFEKFQAEVEMMSRCLNINQVHATGTVITYIVREHARDLKSFEVMFDKATVEVRCICGGFFLNGYLCRHALSVLNHNGVDEIPISYILSRWRKDCERLHVPDFGSNVIDISNPVQWREHLHKRAMQLVEEGMISQDHYTSVWEAFLETLNKVRLSMEKHV